MAERDRLEIPARLRRLPGQLLLSLINGTAILVIIASILALVSVVRIENLAATIAATATQAVLSTVDLPSKDVLQSMRELTVEVRALANALGEIKTGENPVLESKIARLNSPLTELRISIDRLGNARSILTDKVFSRFGDAIARTLTKLRDCSSTPVQ